MAVKETPTVVEEEVVVEAAVEAAEIETSGFSVSAGGKIISTGYVSAEDAKAFIEGHLEGNGDVVDPA